MSGKKEEREFHKGEISSAVTKKKYANCLLVFSAASCALVLEERRGEKRRVVFVILSCYFLPC